MKKYSETPPALTKCSSEHSETSAAPAAMASEASEGFAAVAGKASERSETFAAPAAAASECSAAPAVTTGNSCSPHAEDYLPHADYADCHRKARAIAGADHPDGKRGRSDAQTSAKVCGLCVRQEKSA